MYPQEESAAGGPRRTLVEEAHANWLETSICVLDVCGWLLGPQPRKSGFCLLPTSRPRWRV